MPASHGSGKEVGGYPKTSVMARVLATVARFRAGDDPLFMHSPIFMHEER